MELIVFNRDNTTSVRSSRSTLNVSINGGVFLFSKGAAREFGLQNGDKILIGQDKGNPKKWFFTKADTQDKSAFELSLESGVLKFRCVGLARKILSSFKEKKRVLFLLPNETIEYKKNKFYTLIPIQNAL